MDAGTPSREVVLHVGMSRAGSAGLHRALIRNRAALAGAGIDYPLELGSPATPTPQPSVEPNGRLLVDLLAPRGEAARTGGGTLLEAARAALRGADLPRVLFSSEDLFRFDVGRLAAFRDALASDGVTVRAAVVVRDVVPHALSSFSRRVRFSLHTGSFGEYVDEEAGGLYRYGAEWRLRRLVETLGGDNVTVLHFDSLATPVFRTFAGEALGVRDLSGFDLTTTASARGLTRREVEVRRSLNGHLGDKRGGHRVNAALARREPLGREQAVTRAELDFLVHKFGREVDWINAQFFPDRRLAVAGPEVEVVADDDDLVASSEVVACLNDCLSDLMTTSGA